MGFERCKAWYRRGALMAVLCLGSALPAYAQQEEAATPLSDDPIAEILANMPGAASKPTVFPDLFSLVADVLDGTIVDAWTVEREGESIDGALLQLPAGDAATRRVFGTENCARPLQGGAVGSIANVLASREGLAGSLNEELGLCSQSAVKIGAAPDGHSGADVSLSLFPELAQCADGQCSLQRVKGRITFGENGTALDGAPQGWYVFAGADGKILAWDNAPGEALGIGGQVALQDRVTMGDVEAGLALTRGPADLSLSFIHRESKFQTWDTRIIDNEQFVGLKLTVD